MQQGRHGKFQVEVVDPHADRSVVGPDDGLVEHDIGCRQQLEVDGAADRHFLAERVRQPRLHESALAVPVYEVRRRQRRRQHDDQDDGKHGEEVAQG